jgi:hypothetical protein
MKKSLNGQGKKLQLNKETLKNMVGGGTLKTPAELEYGPGTTDWTCTEFPSDFGC